MKFIITHSHHYELFVTNENESLYFIVLNRELREGTITRSKLHVYFSYIYLASFELEKRQ